MGAGASSKSDENSREDLRKVIKNLKSVAEPVTFIVDQGGGSFRAYIFSGLKQVIRVKSVNAWERLMDKSKLATYTENIGSNLINEDDGTFNDYSTAKPEHYKYICDCLATAYENAFIELCELTKIAPASVSSKRIVRQTGKIRTVLHTQKDQGDAANFHKWNTEFTSRLGKQYDYKLLSNQDEAMLESSAFFELNDHVDDSFIGVGMGSSSTQVYGNGSKGHYCNFNSFCGCKPSKDQKTKEVDLWTKDFSALFNPMFRSDKQTTVVLLNAIGYVFISMATAEYPGKDEFLPKIKAAEKINPSDFFKWTTSYADAVKGDSEHEWSSNLLLGLAKTLASISRCQWVICERKGPVGASLDFDTSWSKYLILLRLREMARQEAAAKAPTGKYTDAERDAYKKEIEELQQSIIGNPTQVLTLEQVKALSADKWESKILHGRKTPKQCFDTLKNEDGVITRDQWQQHFTAIASLKNTRQDEAGNGRDGSEQKSGRTGSAWTSSSEKL